MPGPTPNRAKLNSRSRVGGGTELVALPATGCDLPVPPIPAGREWTAAERELWAELWSSPQATEWDDAFRHPVAAYITYSTALMSGEASAWHAQEFRHLGDKLGLTPAGLAALGWRIVDDRPAATVHQLGGAS